MLTPSLLALILLLVIFVLVLILHVSNRGRTVKKSTAKSRSRSGAAGHSGSGSKKDRNCCTSCCSLCWTFCCPPCPPCIAAKIAFKPPPEATYAIEGTNKAVKSRKSAKSSSSHKRAGYLRLHGTAKWPFTKHDLSKFSAFYADTDNGGRIACLYLPGDSRRKPKYTLLFSHGNACDLGQMASLYLIFTRLLPVNIFSYDYQGYGISSGSPSERNLYADIDAAYKTLLDRFGVPPKRIILYGQSIGSAPTIDLASRTRGLGGVVIQSGLSSGLRLVCPSMARCCCCCDSFRNVNKVGDITAPVLVVHGTADEIIPVEHGIELYQKAPRTVEACWVQDAGHNDVVNFNDFILRMKRFIGELDQIEAGLLEI